MKTKINIFTTAVLLLTVAATGHAMAGTALTGDQLKALISDKTVSSHHNFKGFDFKVFFGADGKMIQGQRDGSTMEGTWKVNDAGEHCIEIGSKSNCATIEDNGDGTYTRVRTDNGKRPINWTGFADGNQM